MRVTTPDPARADAPVAPPAAVSRRAAVVFTAAVVAYFVAVVHRTAMGVAGVEAVDRFGLSATGLSMFAVVQLVLYAGMQIPAGRLLDRFGPRAVITVGSLVMAVGQLVLAVADSTPTALVARVLLGAGDAGIFISAVRLIAEWFPPRRAPVMVQVTGLIGQSGQLASAIPVAWVLHHQGWGATFALNGVAKWLQNPSRVPAGRTAARTAGANRSCTTRSRGAALRIPTNATTVASAPVTASTPNVAPHPWWCSTHATGIADASCPD